MTYKTRKTAGPLLTVLFTLALCSSADGWFGGVEPLGPLDKLRHSFAPYSLVELNYLGINYNENLLDKRINMSSYTHLDYDINSWDAWHLQFPDDNARFIEALVFEDRYSPVVRLELVRKLAKGLMAARYPGTKAYHSFRHRNGGKTFLIFDDRGVSSQGRLLLSTWGDAVTGYTKIGFRAKIDDVWYETGKFGYTDEPADAGSARVAREPASGGGLAKKALSEYWNESPFVFNRDYNLEGKHVEFTGKYWFSDEDMPLEFGFSSDDAEMLDIVVGASGEPMALLGDKEATGIIHLPDRTTTYSSKEDGNRVFSSPDFQYLIVSKQTAWACPGYSRALLIMWDGKPTQVEALAENGYGQIRVSYDSIADKTKGKVWLYPFAWVNYKDMGYIFSNAECFLETGKLMHNGFPAQQLLNNIPAGMAAGAYLLSMYNDPFAITARIQAEEAVDAMLLPENNNMKFIRVFSEVRAAVWMVKIGQLLNDKRLIAKYKPWIDKMTHRMLTPESGYDGKGWMGGWAHFYSTRAVWMAYDATGNKEYLDAYKRAMMVYDIDEKGIYRYGKAIKAPGGFETYSGSLPLGAWGHAGKMDKVDKLINLDVPNGWHNPDVPVKRLWNDAGAGPWAQDDANPEYVGYSLKGCDIPQEKKYVLPLGAFPIYDAKGNVKITGQPILDNPYFPKAGDKLIVLSKEDKKIEYDIAAMTFKPGDKTESEYLVQSSGKLSTGRRVFRKKDKPVIYKFDTAGAMGAAIDMTMSGDGYTVEVSPDGKRWYERLNTWSEKQTRHSLDISFLTGSPDELLKMSVITPEDDTAFITEQSKTTVLREYCRYVEKDGYFIYKLGLADVVECHLELIVGNSYKVQFSKDGKNWDELLNASLVKTRNDRRLPNAAWLRIVDVTQYLNRNGCIYMRFTNADDLAAYDGHGAFLRRLTVYGVFDSENIYVRLSNARYGKGSGFTLGEFSLRKWSK